MITKIINESQLKEKLQRDIAECEKERIVIQAGHFPLIYTFNGAIEGIRKWGVFSIYTLELGCEAGQFARNLDKEVQFVFFADDHSYEGLSGLTASQISHRRNRLYREKSGTSAVLISEYRDIMGKFGFDERDILRHNHGKNGRESCLYFSEKILRASAIKIENACAREYVSFIENPEYFDKKVSYLISFVPQRCRGHICDVALDQEIEGLSASHVFMESMAVTATREELFNVGQGIVYRRD